MREKIYKVLKFLGGKTALTTSSSRATSIILSYKVFIIWTKRVSFTANALEYVMPPPVVFWRIRFQDHIVRVGPSGAVVTANQSGRMQG